MYFCLLHIAKISWKKCCDISENDLQKPCTCVFACWQAWTWSSLNMVQLVQLEHGCWQACSCMLEQTVHGQPRSQGLISGFMAWWTNRRCSYMIEHVVREWWNNKIEQRCYNNHELGCCIKSGFACSNMREQPLSIRQTVTICWKTWLNNTAILPILFYHVNSAVTELLHEPATLQNLWYFSGAYQGIMPPGADQNIAALTRYI